MDVSKRDEAIAVVVSLTGAEEELALFLLEENNWNIDMCVRSYLNNEIADEEKPICRENPKRKIRSPIRNTSGIISENPFATEDRKTSLLMREKEPFGNYKEDLKMLPGRRFSRKKRTRSCFGMDTEDDLISSSNQVDELKRKRLSDLFRLPLDLNFCGNFDSVKHHCRISQKWLLVNIQSAIEFSCLQLNRDTWSDSSVRSVLCEHFILWQVSLSVRRNCFRHLTVKMYFSYLLWLIIRDTLIARKEDNTVISIPKLAKQCLIFQ